MFWHRIDFCFPIAMGFEARDPCSDLHNPKEIQNPCNRVW